MSGRQLFSKRRENETFPVSNKLYRTRAEEVELLPDRMLRLIIRLFFHFPIAFDGIHHTEFRRQQQHNSDGSTQKIPA